MNRSTGRGQRDSSVQHKWALSWRFRAAKDAHIQATRRPRYQRVAHFGEYASISRRKDQLSYTRWSLRNVTAPQPGRFKRCLRSAFAFAVGYDTPLRAWLTELWSDFGCGWAAQLVLFFAALGVSGEHW